MDKVSKARRVSGGSSSSRRTTASTGRRGSMGKPWLRYSATSALARTPERTTNQGAGSMTNSSGVSDVRQTPRDWFVADSALEGSGFEPSVPRRSARVFEQPVPSPIMTGPSNNGFGDREPKVRIHLSPAGSQQRTLRVRGVPLERAPFSNSPARGK
jgi:hypothetical protein